MNQPLVISEKVLGSLRATRPWVKFLSIVGFVMTVFMVLFGLAMATGMVTTFSMPGTPAFFGTAFGIFYIVIAFAYVMPFLYLYRYAKAIAGVQSTPVMASFEDALKQQKSFWKYIGIFIIVVLVLYILLIFGAVFAAIFVAAHHH